MSSKAEKEKKRRQIFNIKNETRVISINPTTDIKKIVRRYDEQLNPNKFSNINGKDKFLKNYKLSQLVQYE